MILETAQRVKLSDPSDPVAWHALHCLLHQPMTPPLRSSASFPPRLAFDPPAAQGVARGFAGKPLLAWVVEPRAPVRNRPGAGRRRTRRKARSFAIASASRPTHLAIARQRHDRVHAVAQLHDAGCLRQHPRATTAAAPGTHHCAAAPLRAGRGRCVYSQVRCTEENIANPNAVKVVTDGDDRALYFPAPPSLHRDGRRSRAQYWKHIGLTPTASARSTSSPRCRRARWTRRAPGATPLPGERPLQSTSSPPSTTPSASTRKADLRLVEARLRALQI